MRALVTGGTGFVGGHLVAVLRARGIPVTALVRSPARAGPLEAAGARLVRGNLDDTDAIERALDGARIIYHVAGLTAARNAAEFHRVNVEGTRRLLDAATSAGITRFVLVSSLAAAGPSPRGGRRVAADPTEPVTGYGRSKAAAEAIVRAGGLAWTIARPPAVYGPRDVEMLKVFRAARLGVAPVFGDGSQQLSLVYGPDLAEALAAMGSSPAAEGKVYYPAHPQIVTSAELVRTIGHAMGRRMRLIPLPRAVATGILHLTGAAARLAGKATLLNPDKANEFFQPAWTCDPAPLERDTGWRASHDLASGVAETLSWYRREGWM